MVFQHEIVVVSTFFWDQVCCDGSVGVLCANAASSYSSRRRGSLVGGTFLFTLVTYRHVQHEKVIRLRGRHEIISPHCQRS
jgi:hypothetical protein